MARAFRIDIKTQCVLNYADKEYPVRLENLSADGALVTLLAGKLPNLEANELCSLVLGNHFDSRAPKNSCKVVRFDPDNQKVGVEFLNAIEDSVWV